MNRLTSDDSVANDVSFMYTKTKGGRKTDPWVTPAFINQQSQIELVCVDHYVLLMLTDIDFLANAGVTSNGHL